MPRRLKVFRTHIGFYDTIVAAPSMKVAAQSWGTNVRVFAQGFAEEIKDPAAVQAALAQPGVVLKRPFGTHGAYKAEPDAIPAPNPTRRQKQEAAKADQARKRKKAAEKRAEAEAARQAKKNAQAELADIEQEEAKLRQRRQTLKKKFRLRSV